MFKSLFNRTEASSSQPGRFVQFVSDSVLHTADKIIDFLSGNPREILYTGVMIGGGLGFLFGLQAGTLLGYSQCILARKFL